METAAKKSQDEPKKLKKRVGSRCDRRGAGENLQVHCWLKKETRKKSLLVRHKKHRRCPWVSGITP